MCFLNRVFSIVGRSLVDKHNRNEPLTCVGELLSLSTSHDSSQWPQLPCVTAVDKGPQERLKVLKFRDDHLTDNSYSFLVATRNAKSITTAAYLTVIFLLLCDAFPVVCPGGSALRSSGGDVGDDIRLWRYLRLVPGQSLQNNDFLLTIAM